MIKRHLVGHSIIRYTSDNERRFMPEGAGLRYIPDPTSPMYFNSKATVVPNDDPSLGNLGFSYLRQPTVHDTPLKVRKYIYGDDEDDNPEFTDYMKHIGLA